MHAQEGGQDTNKENKAPKPKLATSALSKPLYLTALIKQLSKIIGLN
jgi:hypothetical protein